MALDDEVRTRIGSQRLIELTRANESTEATSENTTRTDAAVADVEARFRIHAQQTFDDTDARHIALGVEGVVLTLQRWNADSDTLRQAYERWVEALDALAQTTVRARVLPIGTADWLDYPSEANTRSLGDRRNYEQILLNRPSVGGTGFETVSEQ